MPYTGRKNFRKEATLFMTGKERIQRLLQLQPCARAGLFEHFWVETHKGWEAACYLPEDASFEDHFGYDMHE